jgi:hypothetical protein
VEASRGGWKIAPGRPSKKVRIIAAIVSLISIASQVQGQGRFLFCNSTAPTRIGSIDGPFAGPEIFARMLVGETPDSLVPVGPTVPHAPGGVVFDCLTDHVTVPGIPPAATAYFETMAWDGNAWGTAFESVPVDQIGRTDIVPLILSGSTLPDFAPLFTRPAIVPIPEPSVVTLAVLGGGLFLLRAVRSLWHRNRKDSSSVLNESETLPLAQNGSGHCLSRRGMWRASV